MKSFKDMPPWEWPDDARVVLLEVMRNRQASDGDRLQAAEMAGDLTVINDDAVDALLAILRSSDESVPLRGTAAIALGPVLESADIEGFNDDEETLISEETFGRIQACLHALFTEPGTPKDLRRRALEASVRAPQEWHADAIRTAYASDDEDWKLTAVASMHYVRGFEEQILEALESPNPEIHYEAVRAAGSWAVDAAWEHVAALVASVLTEKPLLLVAIDAVASIRPREAEEVLAHLITSEDEDISDAVTEALAMSAGLSGEDDEENGEDETRQ